MTAACVHCETRPLCECPAGPAKCAAGACPCGPQCPCPIAAPDPQPQPHPPPPPPPPVRRWGFGLWLLLWILLLWLGLWWWETTPHVAFGLLLFVPFLALWGVLFLCGFGRREMIVELPPPLRWPWLFLLMALVPFGLGWWALLDGAESRAGILLLLLALLYGLVAWPRIAMMLLALAHLRILVIVAPTILLGVVLALLGFGRTDLGFGAIAVLVASLWFFMVVALPWGLGRRLSDRQQRIPVEVLAVVGLATLTAVLVAAVMLLVHGRDPEPGSVDSAAQDVETVPVVDDPVVDDPDGGDPVEDNSGGTTSSSIPEDPPPPVNVGYFVAMSDGRNFPIYLFDRGSEQQLGIVLDRPDECWLLQYDIDVADRIGECRQGLQFGTEPQAAIVIYESETSIVALVRTDESVVVTDLFATQGFAEDLESAQFATIDATSDQIEIDGEVFVG